MYTGLFRGKFCCCHRADLPTALIDLSPLFTPQMSSHHSLGNLSDTVKQRTTTESKKRPTTTQEL